MEFTYYENVLNDPVKCKPVQCEGLKEMVWHPHILTTKQG